MTTPFERARAIIERDDRVCLREVDGDIIHFEGPRGRGDLFETDEGGEYVCLYGDVGKEDDDPLGTTERNPVEALRVVPGLLSRSYRPSP